MHDGASEWLSNYYMQIKQGWVASIFVIGSGSEVLPQLWMWSWQDAEAERVICAQPAAARYEVSDLSWLSAAQQLRAWSQPLANVFLCPILCSWAQCPKRVDTGPARQSFEKQYQSNRYQEADNLWLQDDPSSDMSVMC